MERLNTRIRGGGTNVWIALAAIVGIFALVLSTLVVASPTASAQETSTESYSDTADSITGTDATSGEDVDQLNRSLTELNDMLDAGDTEQASPVSPGPSEADSQSDESEAAEAPKSETAESEQQAIEAFAAGATAVNTDIEVEVTSFAKRSDTTGENPIHVNDYVNIEGTWDATNANPQPGDQFTVELPDELKSADLGPFNLEGDGGPWGTCVVTGDVLTCTLSNAVIGKDQIKGTWQLSAQATKSTTLKDLDFTINGEPVKVPTPGDGGIISDKSMIDKSRKTGSISGDNKTINWTIDIPGTALAKDPEVIPYTFIDTPSSNHKLCEGTQPVLSAWDDSRNPGGSKVDLPSSASVSAGQSGAAINFTLDPGATEWNEDVAYRITYKTCPTSGNLDPVDTKYTNSAELPDGTVGVGDDAPHPSWKSGSRDNGSNWKKFNWTVKVPGTAWGDDELLTITDTLTDDHSFDAQYDKVTVTPTIGKSDVVMDISGDSKTATIKLPKPDGLQPSDVYTVTYSTVYSGTEGTPQPGENFNNKVKVGNNPEATASTNVPGNQTAKNGSLSTDAVGDNPAGTAIKWNVTIDGRDVNKVTDPLKVKDTIVDGNHKLCTDIAPVLRAIPLNKNFTDADGNKLEEFDVPGVTVTPGGDGVNEFTIPVPQNGYSRDYKYVLTYYTCTTSGGVDKPGTSYKNKADINGVEKSGSATQNYGGSGTGQGVDSGSFALTKKVVGESNPNSEFTVKVQEFENEAALTGNTPANSYDLKVKDGQSVSGKFSRGKGWIIKLTEPVTNVDGQNYIASFVSAAGGDPLDDKSGVDVSDGGKTALVYTDGGKNKNIQLLLNNTVQKGQLKVTKEVTGDPAAKEAAKSLSYPVTAIVDGTDYPFTLFGDGSSYTIKDLPIGAKVKFRETLPDNGDITWGTPTINGKPIDQFEMTVGDNPDAAITLKNEAKTPLAGLSIQKTVTGSAVGNPNVSVPQDYTVDATWEINGQAGSATAVVKNGAAPIEFKDASGAPIQLPKGTKVTLKENLPANGNGIAWSKATFAGQGVVDNGDNTAVVTVGNDAVVISVHNVAELNDGIARVVKKVTSSDGSDKEVKNAEFGVQARWQVGLQWRVENITVKNDGVAVPISDEILPVGTVVKLRETKVDALDGQAIEWAKTGEWSEAPGIAVDGDFAELIISDNPEEGRLATLTNTSKWMPGAVSFEKKIIDGDKVISPEEAVKKGLMPETAQFQVEIKTIDLPTGQTLPENAGIAVGDKVTLNAANKWKWTSDKVLPKGTKVTFAEVTPVNLPGVDWGAPEFSSEPIEVGADETAVVKIKNTPIPTTPVDVDKSVTGPKGKDVEKDESSTFQVKATWTAWDGEKSCIFDVVPGKSAVPAEGCEATIIDDKVYFPRNTEITFEEVGQNTDVPNVKWQEVLWTIAKGKADITVNESEDETKAPTATVTITGDKDVTIGLENKTSSNGLIIIPIPIPLPPFPGGSSNPPTPNTPVTPGKPGEPTPGKPGHPGKPLPQSPSKSDQAQSAKGSSSQKGLARTGANVIWLAGGALLLLAAGAFLITRNKKRNS